MSSEISLIDESPLKKAKPKLEEEEVSRNSPRSANSSDDEGFEHIKDKEVIEQCKKYEREINESNGFDVSFSPPAFRSVIGSHIVPCDFNDPEVTKLIHESTHFAIAEYNRLMKNKSQLEFVKVEKANMQHSFNYVFFITFEAVDTLLKQSGTVTYQTEIFCGKAEKEMFFIRRKGQKKGILFPVDLNDREEYQRIEKCTLSAISQHNEFQDGEPQLQLLKIVKAVQDTMECRTYGITFRAMDPTLDQSNTYCAAVLYGSPEKESLCLQHLWPKGERNHDFTEYEGDE